MNIVALIPEKHGDYFQYPLEGYKLLYGNPSKGEGLPRVAK
jgi:hypothetical protein